MIKVILLMMGFIAGLLASPFISLKLFRTAYYYGKTGGMAAGALMVLKVLKKKRSHKTTNQDSQSLTQ